MFNNFSLHTVSKHACAYIQICMWGRNKTEDVFACIIGEECEYECEQGTGESHLLFSHHHTDTLMVSLDLQKMKDASKGVSVTGFKI